MMSGILIAGIGNIFRGDDGFGVEVAMRLARRSLPADVHVVDFGIRGIDLTYALMDGYSAVVMVDTMKRGEAPGTVSVIEPRPKEIEVEEPLGFSPHKLDPVKAWQVARLLGGNCPRLLVIACEPLTFGDEDGAMGLSAPVMEAVEPAVAAAELLARRLLGELEMAGEATQRQGSVQ
jgi:hydrogenase maturation protease